MSAEEPTSPGTQPMRAPGRGLWAGKAMAVPRALRVPAVPNARYAGRRRRRAQRVSGRSLLWGALPVAVVVVLGAVDAVRHNWLGMGCYLAFAALGLAWTGYSWRQWRAQGRMRASRA